jgi:hypothetical protein
MREGKVSSRAPYAGAQVFLMNSSPACPRGSSFASRAVIALTGSRTKFTRFLPGVCDRSLFRTSPLYFRMLPDAPNSFVRRAADTLCSDHTVPSAIRS